MDTKFDVLRAIIRSSQFSPFVEGVMVPLPTGERLRLKIESVKQFQRPKGFRFFKYTYITGMRANGIHATGCGESNYKILAIQKSIAEAIERTVFKALKGTSFSTITSNGWATHLNRKNAERAALFELLERDAALVHWFNKEPMLEISFETCPAWFQKWKKAELSSSQFSNVRILLSTQGHLPTISVFLLGKDGLGVVSHAAAPQMEQALSKAAAESCRLAYMARHSLYSESTKSLFKDKSSITFGPQHHAVAYAYQEQFPHWLFGRQVSWQTANDLWKNKVRTFQSSNFRYQFNEIFSGPLSVGFCESKMTQNLFFGNTLSAVRDGFINFNRLGIIETKQELNIKPHFVA